VTIATAFMVGCCQGLGTRLAPDVLFISEKLEAFPWLDEISWGSQTHEGFREATTLP